MTTFLERMEASRSGRRSAANSFLAMMTEGVEDADAKYGFGKGTSVHPYVLRANARLEAMGAFQADTPNLRAKILNEERMRDGGKNQFAVDHAQRGMSEYNETHMLSSYSAGVMQSLGGVGESLIGLYAPEMSNRMASARTARYGTPEGIAGMVGQAVGTFGSIAASIGTGGAGTVLGAASATRGMAITSGLFAQQGAGGVRQAVAQQRAMGHEISWQAEWSAAIATGILEGGSGALSAGVSHAMGKKLAKKLMAIAPDAVHAYRYGGRSATLRFLKNILPGMGVEGTEEYLTQVAANGVNMLAEITPGLTITEGALEAGLMGAGMAPLLGGVSMQAMGLRAAASQQGEPTPPGTTPDPNGSPTHGIPDAWEPADPQEANTGSLTPVRNNGPAHVQTQEMYVANQNEKALNRADKAISGVAAGNRSIENALYKALGMAPPTTGEKTKADDHISRLDTMGRSKAKPKTLTSEKTVTAIAKRLREADPTLSVPDAKELAQNMIAVVDKATKRSVMGKEALARHERLYYKARNKGKGIPKAVADEYAKPVEDNNQQIDVDPQETWDNDAWGSDEESMEGEFSEGDVDTREEVADMDEIPERWGVVEDPDAIGKFAIVDENGEAIEGPFDSEDAAKFQLKIMQEESTTGMEESIVDETDALDGWEFSPEMPNPPERNDGLPPNSDPMASHAGARSNGALKRQANDKLVPISTRIWKASKRIFGKLMDFESGLAYETSRTIRFVTDWGHAAHRSFKKHGKVKAIELKKRLSLMLNNGKYDDAYTLLMEYAPNARKGSQLVAGLKNIRNKINALRQRQIAAGIPVGKVENYFPRAVKDYDNYMARQGKEKRSSITKKIEAAEKKSKTPLTEEDKIEIINADLQGYGEQFREHSVRHTAQRTVDEVTADNLDLYESYDVALVQYLARTIEGIHVAKFFGKGNGNVEESIGAYLRKEQTAGNITEEQLQEIQGLLKSRFVGAQRTPNKFNQVVRDVGYISTIANTISAVTQIGDVALSLVENGLIHSLRGAGLALSTDGKRMFDIGLVHASAEFGNPGGLSKFLDTMMTVSQFKRMDALGKTLHINSSYVQMRAAAMGQRGTHVRDGKVITNKTDSKAYIKFEREWSEILGGDLQQTVSDLRGGIMTDNVRMVLFTKLSKIQPISLSEFPAYYLNHPNQRIFYMLKSFTIKQFDYLKKESFDHLAKGMKDEDMGEILEGSKGIAKIAFVFMAFFGVDLLKDFLMQRETNMDNISDKAVATFLKMAGTSRYSLNTVKTDGIGAAAWGAIAPPTQWATDPLTDLMNIPDFLSGEKSLSEIRSYRNAPLLGKWMYYGFGHGNTLDAKKGKTARRNDRKGVIAEARKAILDDDGVSAHILIEHYNDSKPDDMERIRMKNIRNSIKRERRKIRDEESGLTALREERRLR